MLCNKVQEDNVDVVLHGVDGDLLYATAGRTVLDSIKQQGLIQGFWELKYYKETNQIGWLSAIKTMIFGKIKPVRRWREKAKTSLTEFKNILKQDKFDLLDRSQHWLTETSQGAIRPLQYRLVLDAFSGESAMVARVSDAHYGFEKRYPFRDRDLCEFMLSVPTRFLESLGQKRPIVKHAFVAEFENELLNRNDKTHFVECLKRGIEADQKAIEWFESPDSSWGDYVKECYFERNDVSLINKLVVKWRCAYYNFWQTVGK